MSKIDRYKKLELRARECEDTAKKTKFVVLLGSDLNENNNYTVQFAFTDKKDETDSLAERADELADFITEAIARLKITIIEKALDIAWEKAELARLEAITEAESVLKQLK